jgi:hypothetical protein
MKKTAIVSTSIRVPKMLEDYCKNAVKFQHKDVEMFMIGDKKTPSEARQFCENLTSVYNIPVHYLGIEEQEEALKDYPMLKEIVPYNSACRKILGMLIAYLQGFENLITVDDDNFVTDSNFFKYHDIAGSDADLSLIKSSSGWFNACEYLIEESSIPFYYRGIPWSQRRKEKAAIEIQNKTVHVVVNSGFWLDDPDIDASSRLFWPICVTGMKEDLGKNFGLLPGTWCPFNNQNTAMAREILPAYFTPHNAKRFSDLWPAYVVSCIASHLNHVVSYGFPLVSQMRNPHNYWQDIDDEKVGAQATEPLIAILRSVKFTGNNYHDCLGELIAHLNDNRDIMEKLPTDQKEMLYDFLKCLEVWHEVFSLILNKKQ